MKDFFIYLCALIITAIGFILSLALKAGIIIGIVYLAWKLICR